MSVTDCMMVTSRVLGRLPRWPCMVVTSSFGRPSGTAWKTAAAMLAAARAGRHQDGVASALPQQGLHDRGGAPAHGGQRRGPRIAALAREWRSAASGTPGGFARPRWPGCPAAISDVPEHADVDQGRGRAGLGEAVRR